MYWQLQLVCVLRVEHYYLNKGVYDVNRLEGIMMSLEYLLNNQRKRHIMGETLLSASLLLPD